MTAIDATEEHSPPRSLILEELHLIWRHSIVTGTAAAPLTFAFAEGDIEQLVEEFFTPLQPCVFQLPTFLHDFVHILVFLVALGNLPVYTFWPYDWDPLARPHTSYFLGGTPEKST